MPEPAVLTSVGVDVAIEGEASKIGQRVSAVRNLRIKAMMLGQLRLMGQLIDEMIQQEAERAKDATIGKRIDVTG